MAKQMPTYWGCVFTHSLPFLIKSTNKVLSELGITTYEIEGTTCCPDPVYLKTHDPKVHLTLAARNLALIGETSDKFLVVCNGCYHSLHGATTKLEDEKLKEDINEALDGKEKYQKEVEVVHLHKLLTDKAADIQKLSTNRLSGLRVAVFYGCHALRPPAVPTDDPENPSSLDSLVEATGAESVPYETKLDCCGIPIAGFDADQAEKMLEAKLVELKDKVDCIVTTCPSCFLQFDRLPSRLKPFSTPVLHISELLVLAFGVPEEELDLRNHATKLVDLMEKITSLPNYTTASEQPKIHIDPCQLANHCGACRKECTAAIATADSANPFDPLKFVDAINEGKIDEVLNDPQIWTCLQCGECEVRCPQNNGCKEVIEEIRTLALERGIQQPAIEHNLKMVKETGYTQQPREVVRKRLGMKPAPELDTKKINDIIAKIEKNKK